MKKYITLGVVLSLITGGSYALEKGKKTLIFSLLVGISKTASHGHLGIFNLNMQQNKK